MSYSPNDCRGTSPLSSDSDDSSMSNTSYMSPPLQQQQTRPRALTLFQSNGQEIGKYYPVMRGGAIIALSNIPMAPMECPVVDDDMDAINPGSAGTSDENHDVTPMNAIHQPPTEGNVNGETSASGRAEPRITSRKRLGVAVQKVRPPRKKASAKASPVRAKLRNTVHRPEVEVGGPSIFTQRRSTVLSTEGSKKPYNWDQPVSRIVQEKLDGLTESMKNSHVLKQLLRDPEVRLVIEKIPIFHAIIQRNPELIDSEPPASGTAVQTTGDKAPKTPNPGRQCLWPGCVDGERIKQNKDVDRHFLTHFLCFECPKCGRFFSRADALIRHVKERIHCMDEARRYFNEVCHIKDLYLFVSFAKPRIIGT